MRLLHASSLAGFVAACLFTPVMAQDAQGTRNALVTIFGEDGAARFDPVYETITAHIADPAAMAELGSYPFQVQANNELYDIIRPSDFVENFDRLVMSDTITAVAATDYADLIVTSEGVGFANGALWVSLVCLDQACANTQWGIIRINN